MNNENEKETQMADTEQLVASAEQIKNTFAEEAAAVTASGYTEEVEKAQIADLYLEAAEKLDGLRAEFEKANESDRIARGRNAFGADDLLVTGADPMVHTVSYRDATARAAEVFDDNGGNGLRRLLENALMTGDELLARAAAVRAFQRGAHEVVEAYEQTHPGWTERARAARDDKRNTSVFGAIKFGIRRPPQIADMGRDRMARYRDKVNAELTEKATAAKRNSDRYAAARIGL